jgi:hypothetical protein
MEGQEAAMSIQNISDICYEIASRIAEGTGGVRNRSAISASQYVDVTLYDDDDETIGTWSARISDHEARSYNRIGSFNIGVGRLGSDDHEWIRAAWVTETVDREEEIDDVDDNGTWIKRTITVTDEETRFEYDADDIDAAVAAAIAAFEAWKERIER